MKRALSRNHCGISYLGNFSRFPLLIKFIIIHILLAFMEREMAKKTVTAKDSLIRNPDVILREEDPDGALLFNPDTNQIRVINTTGLFIWNHCNGKKDLPTIVSSLKETFDGVPEAEVDNQVKAFIDDMKANGFLGVPEQKRK
jgi:hypothetical protein